jgi:hypothetical protein
MLINRGRRGAEGDQYNEANDDGKGLVAFLFQAYRSLAWLSVVRIPDQAPPITCWTEVHWAHW